MSWLRYFFCVRGHGLHATSYQLAFSACDCRLKLRVTADAPENLHCMWPASRNVIAELRLEKLTEDAWTLYWGSVATDLLKREKSDSFPISVCGICLPHACMCRRAGGRELSKTFSRRLIWRDLAYWQLHHWPHMAVRPMRTHYSEQVIYFASPPVFPLVTPSYHLCGQPYLPHSPTDRF
jgi:hypothetical protein